MKILITIVTIIIASSTHAQELELIKSELTSKGSDIYEESIEDYIQSEFWGIWTMPIGSASSSSCLQPQGDLQYSVNNLCDYDLTTAWVEGSKDYGIGETISFIFNFPDNTEFAGAYQFYGQINLFNGYCKNLKTWEENSRIKSLKVYYNEKPVCIVELIDTWHFQYFNIGKFFKNRREQKYLDAEFEITEGDKLSFEILEVYPGTKYKDVALSEFMAEGAGN